MAGRMDILGQTGLDRQMGDVLDEWHRKLQGRRGARTYREMRDMDATIGASIHVITSLVRNVRWHAEPADAEDLDAAKEQAEFLDGCLNDMSHTWEDFMGEVLSMIWYGWAYFEKVYKVRGGEDAKSPKRRSKFDDGKIGWRMISIRGQESLDDWLFDQDGGIRGMFQCAAPDYKRVFIPIEKSLLFRTELNKNNPEGRSLLRNAYRSYYFKKRLEELEAVGIQKDMVGTPVARLPVSYLDNDAEPNQKAVAQSIFKQLKKFQRNEQEVLVYPSSENSDGTKTGFDIHLMSTGGQRQIDIDASIKRYQKDIAMVLGTQFIFLGMDNVGSNALSSDMTNIMATGLGAMLDSIEDVFNRFAVDELFELNGVPEGLRPRLVHGDLEKEDLIRFAKMMLDLTNAGHLTPDSKLEDWVRVKYELPEQEDMADDAFFADPASQPPAPEIDTDKPEEAESETLPTESQSLKWWQFFRRTNR